MKGRIERLRALLAQDGLDAALINGAAGIRYFSGFTSEDATVLVTGRSCCLFTDFRYTIQAREQTEGYEVVECDPAHLTEALAAVLARDGCRRCGFEADRMTVAQHGRLVKLPAQLVPLSRPLAALRMIESPDEIESLRRAQQLADRSFSELLGRVHAGMTEREVVAELNYIGARLGSEGPSFDPIAGSGPNGAMCHAVPSERRLQAGDLVVLDFGCVVDGYHSDMTRTFAVGHASDECRRIYDIVREAHERALDALRAGVTGRALDAVARDYIAAQGYGACFGHSLGHGFGLEIHEEPRASTRSETVFEPGMTITIEPGIYVEGLCGVRIEDCCVVTEDGYIDLVSSPKELLIVS